MKREGESNPKKTMILGLDKATGTKDVEFLYVKEKLQDQRRCGALLVAMTKFES